MESVRDKGSDMVSVYDDDDGDNFDNVHPLLINSYQDALKWPDNLKLYYL
jgi:hypothetical protein